ncbi:MULTISPECIES: hypothetical protein [unclassified Microcoleus]|uniref:hypothetical protein n=1 Tax=unclassified Microcoleus TaxID=2642155 RepID=UPI0025EAD92B|nr:MULTISPECIES: hypothetical protein [unclassified Microcoleus]
MVRQESGVASCWGDRKCLTFVWNAIIAIANRVNYLQEARSTTEQGDRTPNQRFLLSRVVQQSNKPLLLFQKIRF